MKCPRYAVVVVHGISDKSGGQQAGFSSALAKQVIPDPLICDQYWIESVWESVNNALDDKIQDTVLQLTNIYDKTRYWRDSELKKVNCMACKACIWIRWLTRQLLTPWFIERTTRALDLVLDLPMYLGEPKGKKIRDIVKESIQKALTVSDEGVVLIGHSLGSVIAYDVIRESLAENGDHFPIKAFITMGSPLAWVTDLRVADKEVDDQPFRIGDIAWYNFFDEQDPVPLKKKLPESRFPDVKNESAICSGEKYINAHTVYWQREEIAKTISELIFEPVE